MPKPVLTVKAFQGDAKTLLAFDLPQANTRCLAGFTIQFTPKGKKPSYVFNKLQFQHPEQHAQDATHPANSSINAPIHKFRWVHVPGLLGADTTPTYGDYAYTVTPRYFDDAGSLQALDVAQSVSVTVPVKPFKKLGLELGFTRGFVQSQAFVSHFGPKATIAPKDPPLVFDTKAVAGKNADGRTYTYDDEYAWLGFTARQKILGVLDDAVADKNLSVDVFAYDLNEPAVISRLVTLGKQGRCRVILDNAKLHHDPKAKKPSEEDEFEQMFAAAAKAPAAILRGKFGNFAHDKVFVVSKKGVPQKVLTGSTNFSVTGLYVNSNHVLVFNDPAVAAKYQAVFDAAWKGKVGAAAFRKSPLSSETFAITSPKTPTTEITFAPHTEEGAGKILAQIVKRMRAEAKRPGGSVMFAVMGLDKGGGPVVPALNKLHADPAIFTYGISDTPEGISLYVPKQKTGLLVTGKPVDTKLPPPFSQVPKIGFDHQIHHKFIVCGFDSDDPVVYCGSSNLALGGESNNGDNLIAIHDPDVACAFMIEAVALVDHFEFLDGRSTQGTADRTAADTRSATTVGWFLSTTDAWTAPYYDAADLHSADRQLFASHP